MSSSDSNERPLNECSANAQQIKEKKKNKNKEINNNRDKEDNEFLENFNENQIKKAMQISRLEELAIAGKDNQVFD